MQNLNTNIGTEPYQPQLVQYNLALDKGMKYKLTFKASANVARKIAVSFQQSVDPWGDYATNEFDITTTEQEYTFIFTMEEDSDPTSQFAFNLGQATGAVKISDVKLVYTNLDPQYISRQMVTVNHLFSVNGRNLNVSPVNGNVQVKIVDIHGKVKASFNTASAATFSLANIPAGVYYVNAKGAGVNQLKSIVLR